MDETDGRPGGTITARRGDTRARIQRIALALFAEQGYERTALREIAERLEITKAALYYHFRSKEDIAHSLTDDYLAEIDDLIRWARSHPATGTARAGTLRRYVDILLRRVEVLRFMEQNQAAIRGLDHGQHRLELFRDRMTDLAAIVAGPDASLRGRMRAAAALTAAAATCVSFRTEVTDSAELHSIVLEIATDLAG